MSENLFTWTQLGTLAGATSITFLIVAYTKDLIERFWKVGTDLYAVLIAALILFAAATALDGVMSWQLVVLCILNGFLVAAGAGKLNDKAVSSQKKKEESPNETLPL